MISSFIKKNLNTSIKYGLYGFVFLFSWQTRLILRPGEIVGGYSEYLTVSLYASDILLIALLLLQAGNVLLNKPIKKENNKIENIWFLIGGLDLFVFLSCLFALDKGLAFYRYGLFLLGVGLFYLLVTVRYNRLKLIFFFLSGLFLQAILGIWQFLSQSSFACKWLGLAEHNGAELGVSVVEAIGADGIGERWLRAYGGFDHPNVFGGVLAVALLFCIWLLSKSFFDDKIRLERKNNIAVLFFYLVFLLALFFTFSRGAWLATVVGIFVLLLIFLIKKDHFRQDIVLKIVLVSGVLFFILFSQFGYLVKIRFSNESRLEVKSYSERTESLASGWGVIKDNLFFGTGLGNYVLGLELISPNESVWYYQPVHNVFLLVWGEIGIWGLCFFVALLVYIFLLIFRFSFDAKNFSFLLVFAILIMVDHWLWSLHFGVLFFWFVLGVFVASQKFDLVENNF